MLSDMLVCLVLLVCRVCCNMFGMCSNGCNVWYLSALLFMIGRFGVIGIVGVFPYSWHGLFVLWLVRPGRFSMCCCLTKCWCFLYVWYCWYVCVCWFVYCCWYV